MYRKNSPNSFHGYSGQMNYGRPGFYPFQQNTIFRNQPYPYQSPIQNYEWLPYPSQTPYHQSTFQPIGPNVAAGPMSQQNMPFTTGQYPPKDAQFLFQNPLQPQEEAAPNPYMTQMNAYPMMNPYPKQNGMIKQPGGIQSLMNSFKSQDGTVDINKMVNTAGQMVNAVNQVSSLVKGIGGIFKV